MDDDFYEDYECLKDQSSALAHEIALMVLRGEQDQVSPCLLLDYSHSLRMLADHLADHQYMEPGHTFVQTRTQGPVAIQAGVEGSRVARFDCTEVHMSEMPEDDIATICTAISRITPL